MGTPTEIVKTYIHNDGKTFFPYENYEGEITYALVFAHAKTNFLRKINERIKELQIDLKNKNGELQTPRERKDLIHLINKLGRLREKAYNPPNIWCHSAANYILKKIHEGAS